LKDVKHWSSGEQVVACLPDAKAFGRAVSEVYSPKNIPYLNYKINDSLQANIPHLGEPDVTTPSGIQPSSTDTSITTPEPTVRSKPAFKRPKPAHGSSNPLPTITEERKIVEDEDLVNPPIKTFNTTSTPPQTASVAQPLPTSGVQPIPTPVAPQKSKTNEHLPKRRTFFHPSTKVALTEAVLTALPSSLPLLPNNTKPIITAPNNLGSAGRRKPRIDYKALHTRGTRLTTT
jgi:hypothetical protein